MHAAGVFPRFSGLCLRHRNILRSLGISDFSAVPTYEADHVAVDIDFGGVSCLSGPRFGFVFRFEEGQLEVMRELLGRLATASYSARSNVFANRGGIGLSAGPNLRGAGRISSYQSGLPTEESETTLVEDYSSECEHFLN
jgi:hypothetical protein